MKWTAKTPAPTRLPGDPMVTADEVVERLEKAGATLLRLPPSGWSTGARSFWPSVVHDPAEAFGWTAEVVKPSRPSAAEISAMDDTFKMLRLIPDDRYVLRRVVGARALVNPTTGRHIYPWRRIAVVLGCYHLAVQRWHAEGIKLIVAGLNQPRIAA